MMYLPLMTEWLEAIHAYVQAVEAYRTHLRLRPTAVNLVAWYEQAYLMYEMTQTTLILVEEAERHVWQA